jgi:hypothetical protein
MHAPLAGAFAALQVGPEAFAAFASRVRANVAAANANSGFTISSCLAGANGKGACGSGNVNQASGRRAQARGGVAVG